MNSRSSSPETPEASDVPHDVSIHSELPSWYRTLPVSNNISTMEFWDDLFQKPDDPRMLQLDDILQEHVYDDPAYPAVQGSPMSTHPPPATHEPESTPLEPLCAPLRISVRNPGLSMSALPQVHSVPIVPPPAVRTCKRDPASVSRRVVYPSRDSCYNLTILTPNIPETGTKSRVETQVRVAVDLAHASTSAGEQNQYERVGSWKWLKLPPGTSTKRRTRREGKIDPAPQDILHLTATVTCASAPHNRVVSCGSCRNREAKRVARKLAARVRPTHSDSDTPEDGCERPRHVREDTTSIIQFNCADVLDFSAGSTILPVRITCYCRHHREKVGFNIHFTMMDHNGRLVGTGMTPPIMITDDHKSTVKSGGTQTPVTLETQVDWSTLPAVPSSDNPSDSKLPSRNGKGQPKIRSKPYDMVGRTNQSKFSREASISSQSSPTNSPPAPPSTGLNTRSPTPTHLSSSPPPNLTSGTLATDTDFSSALGFSDLVSPSLNNGSGATLFNPPNGGSPMTASQFPPPFTSGSSPVTQSPQLLTGLVPPQPMPFLFFNPGSPSRANSLSLPKIHRLIPSSGPTRGGIEVTILGENFHPALQLNCVFGDVVASSTQRWSDNTLLCILPPRSTPGVVVVWFEGLDETKNPALPSLFTYTDETDRTLMELALQVVGLKMTGKIEDAKNIALRIVGSIGTEDSSSGSTSSANDIMQVASSSFRDLRSLFLHPGERHKYEASVLKFLSVMDVPVENHPGIPVAVALSHTASGGQTLLHIAAFLKFTSLIEFLITRGADLDARDRNGYTALHFAALVQSRDCARILIVAGADLDIVNALGKTAEDIAPLGFFDEITPTTLEGDHRQADLQEDEGDESLEEMESDDDSATVVIKQRHMTSVTRRRPYQPCDDDEQTEKGGSLAPRPFEIPEKIRDSTRKHDDTSDEKQAASFIALIQRTLAQIPAPQGIIPTMPHLPLPHLPEMPAVPWAALPQIPMVFPVIVPMPGWPSFLVDKRDGQRDEVPSGNVNDSRPTTTQELRATWEKWIAIAIASANLRPPPADEAPPMYTPRETEITETVAEEPLKDAMELQEPIRPSPVQHDRINSVDQEVTSAQAPDADAHEDMSVKTQPRTARKYDRMLVLFWLPILLLSLLWAFHIGIRFALRAMRTSVSFKAGVRM